jgi:NAD-dependent deacetylase
MIAAGRRPTLDASYCSAEGFGLVLHKSFARARHSLVIDVGRSPRTLRELSWRSVADTRGGRSGADMDGMHALSAARGALATCRRAAVFSGAGLSAESGIATFRGGDDHALWSRFNPMELASAAGFEENPERVIEWYNWRRRQLAQAQPNAAHVALAKHPQLTQITQNVDELLERAGVPRDNVLHLHGTIGKDRCNVNCGYEEAVDLAQPPPLRRCPDCLAYLRPGVVWFGETLPQHVWNEAQRICSEVDCLLVVGTSASVYPAARLIEHAAAAGAKVISVNTEPSSSFGAEHIELVGPATVLLPQILGD